MDAFAVTGNVLLILFLIALNGFFVAAEFTIVKVRSSKLEELIAEGSCVIAHGDVALARSVHE